MRCAICTPMDARRALDHGADRRQPPAGWRGWWARMAYPAGLTAREVEVLRLVAAGLSNRRSRTDSFSAPAR